jgi:hypothetical protein
MWRGVVLALQLLVLLAAQHRLLLLLTDRTKMVATINGG